MYDLKCVSFYCFQQRYEPVERGPSSILSKCVLCMYTQVECLESNPAELKDIDIGQKEKKIVIDIVERERERGRSGNRHF